MAEVVDNAADALERPGAGSQEQVRSQQVELILRQLDSLPTLPAVATRLLSLTASSQTGSQEVIRLIQADQSLTAKILSLANRADTGIRKEARTVEKVVGLLGFEAIRSAVLSIKVFEMFSPNASKAGGLDRSEFWKHCLAVAAAAEMLARKLHLAGDPEEVFVCGLLHDIGKLALEHCLPKSYARVVAITNSQYGNIADFERRIIGLDHTVLGRRLAIQWHLPGAIEQTIWLHQQPLEAIPEMLPSRKIISLVHLADTIVREQRFGYSGNFSFPASSGELASQLNIRPEALRQIIDELPGEIGQRAKMLGLGQMTSETLYRSALAGANDELGKLYEALRRRAASLTNKAQAFSLMSELGAKLSADMPLSGLCQLMAATWAKAGCLRPSRGEPVAAYAVCGMESSVMAAAETGEDRLEPIMLPCRADFASASVPGPGAPAEGVLPRVVADVQRLGTWLGRCSLLHRPLVCGGRWIGGLLWPAGAQAPELAGEAGEALAVSMAFAAAAIVSRDASNGLAEQLGQASQQLYAAQRSLSEARALSAVGEMAAGAAHEINNPLAVVVGRAQLMAETAGGQDRQTWQVIADQAQRISDIVTEMMEFARPAAPKPQELSAADLIRSAIEALRDAPLTRSLAVTVKVATNTPPLLVDPDQMTRALVELLKNAAAAYAADPAARVEAGLDEVTGGVLLRVIDQGSGMEAEVLNHAFTPFYSARAAGRGRGMGLSRARRLVELAGGKVWLKSAPGQGTTVFVLWPPQPTNQSAPPKEGHA